MSWPVCWRSKNPSSSDSRCAYRRLRRSNSTPSETRPATSRRAPTAPGAATPATTIATASSSQPAAVARADLVDRAAGQPRDAPPCATIAERGEHQRRQDAGAGTGAGSRGAEERCACNQSDSGLRSARRRVWHIRGPHVRRDRPPQPLRHGQRRLGRAPAQRPVPALGEGTAEEKIERLEIALVDEMRRARDARRTPSRPPTRCGAWCTTAPDADPVKQRVTRHHETLARISHKGLR